MDDPAVRRHLFISPKVRKQEEAELEADNKIWIPDAEQGYRLCNVLDEGLTDVLLGFRDEQGFFEKRRVDKKDSEPISRNCLADDLCNLTEPNKATVLDALTRRYHHGVIHTNSGPYCVVLNPWRNLPIYTNAVMEEYRTGLLDNPPHVYAVAQEAYDGIRKGGRNQSILITGESGAGKTENTKKMLEFVLEWSGRNVKTPNGRGNLAENILTTSILLESFGNARTVHNDNSSRFGKFIMMQFDQAARLHSAQIQCYLLEKSRVVCQNEHDRNFHIFYQLLSKGAPESVRKAVGLTGDSSTYRFLNQGIVEDVVISIDDEHAAKLTENAMISLGISDDERLQVYEIVAACAMIGQIRYSERTGMDMSFVEGKKEVEHVANLLKLKANRLVDALTSPTIRVGGKLITKNQNLKKTQFSASAMAKVLYDRLFSWLLRRCNDSISDMSGECDDYVSAMGETCDTQESSRRRFIGILDIAGFEILQKNSFEQFCINFTNEKLQQFFNHFVFVKEQVEYEEEGIIWDHINFAGDLQPTIDIIEKPLGLFCLLEEECMVPNGSGMNLVDKMLANHSNSAVFARAKQSKKNKVISHFTVQHYAGAVDYSVDNWIEKNRDVVETSVLTILSESGHELVQTLFPQINTDPAKQRRGTLSHSSVSFTYKNQLNTLLETLNVSQAHFVRCIITNYEKEPGKVNGPLVLHQLKCNGVLEGIRICRKGYPSRVAFYDFLQRYCVLGGSQFDETGRQGCIKLIDILKVDKDRCQIGKTKVFCKIGVIPELERLRTKWLSSRVILLQAQIRSYLGILDKERIIKRDAAMRTIQKNVRQFNNTTQWPWFKLLNLVRPLIPKDRERLRIEELEKRLREMEEQRAREAAERELWEKRMRQMADDQEYERSKWQSERNELIDSYEQKLKNMAHEMDNFDERLRNELNRLAEEYRKKMRDAQCDYDREIEAAIKEKEKLKSEQERALRALRAQAEAAERKAAHMEDNLRKSLQDKDKEMQKLKANMEQSDDIFDMLEKKYAEQQQKVIALNEALRNYERNLEEAHMQNNDLERENKRLQDSHHRSQSDYDSLCKEHEGCGAIIAELEARIQKLHDENAELKLRIAKLENETEDEKARNKRQMDNTSQLNKLIEELNAKVAKFDQLMLEEKNKRRQVQKERDQIEDDYQHLKDAHDRLKKKYEALKDQLRTQENSITSLEKRIKEKDAFMQECLKDLKHNHKSRLTEVEEKLEQYKKENIKLESENNLNRMRYEAFERESSVDSDYGRSSSGRMSSIGTLGRQYSLTSCSSFSSVRTRGRRETEPDLSNSMYLPRRRDSIVDTTGSYGLQRTNSTVNIEKDRKISDLERQMQTLTTELNLLKRELEVYRGSLSTVEQEKDHLVSTNRILQGDLDNVKRQLSKAEHNADMLALRLKKSHEEAELWKKKHEDLIQETKHEILDERKKRNEQMKNIQGEQGMKNARIKQIEEEKEEVRTELHRCQGDLDRAMATIHDLEASMQSQDFLDATLEHQYKTTISELEALREENFILKARVRRQCKQIELLTQTQPVTSNKPKNDSTNDLMVHMQSKITAE